MKIKTLLERELKLLDLEYEKLCKEQSIAEDKVKQCQFQNEIEILEENKLNLKKLIFSLTWENGVGA